MNVLAGGCSITSSIAELCVKIESSRVESHDNQTGMAIYFAMPVHISF